MVINGEEYRPFKAYNELGFDADTRSFRVLVSRSEPPAEHADIQIQPAIRSWITGHNVVYEAKLPPVRLQGDTHIEFSLRLDDLPHSMRSQLGSTNLEYEVGYFYEGKWKACLESNFIYIDDK